MRYCMLSSINIYSKSCVTLNLEANCLTSSQIYGSTITCWSHFCFGGYHWCVLISHAASGIHFICISLSALYYWLSSFLFFSCVWAHLWRHVRGGWPMLTSVVFHLLTYSFGQGISLNHLMNMANLAIQFALEILSLYSKHWNYKQTPLTTWQLHCLGIWMSVFMLAWLAL